MRCGDEWRDVMGENIERSRDAARWKKREKMMEQQHIS
jgi:hypothetical protein